MAGGRRRGSGQGIMFDQSSAATKRVRWPGLPEATTTAVFKVSAWATRMTSPSRAGSGASLGHNHTSPSRPKGGEPCPTGSGLWAVIRIRQQSQGASVEDNDRTHGLLPSSGSGKRSRSPAALRLALSAWLRSYPFGKGGAVVMTAYSSSRERAALARRP